MVFALVLSDKKTQGEAKRRLDVKMVICFNVQCCSTSNWEKNTLQLSEITHANDHALIDNKTTAPSRFSHLHASIIIQQGNHLTVWSKTGEETWNKKLNNQIAKKLLAH